MFLGGMCGVSLTRHVGEPVFLGLRCSVSLAGPVSESVCVFLGWKCGVFLVKPEGGSSLVEVLCCLSLSWLCQSLGGGFMNSPLGEGRSKV